MKIQLKENELRNYIRNIITEEIEGEFEDGNEESQINGYDRDVWEEATKIVNSLNWDTVKGVKHNGNPKDGYSVLVKCTKVPYESWFDVWIKNGDLTGDWNQFIYGSKGSDLDELVHNYPFEDNGAWSFECFYSAAREYLEENGLVEYDDATDSYRYTNNTQQLESLKRTIRKAVHEALRRY